MDAGKPAVDDLVDDREVLEEVFVEIVSRFAWRHALDGGDEIAAVAGSETCVLKRRIIYVLLLVGGIHRADREESVSLTKKGVWFR